METILLDRLRASYETLVDRQLSREPRGLADEATPTCARRVLVIANRFPPVASVGTVRTAKFVKYLSRFGWQAEVITGAVGRATDEERAASGEDSLLRDVACASVHRLSGFVDAWPDELSRMCARGVKRVFGALACHGEGVAEGLHWRFQRVHDRLAFPDRGIWRLPAALRMAWRLHRQRPFDAIFTTGMPFSDHLIGMAAHRVLNVPWLADFRDPWVEYIHWKQWDSDFGRHMTQRAEAAVIRRAARVISVNDSMTERFRTRYRRVPAERFVTIANGYDPGDFPARPDTRPRTTFKLLYAGSLYGARSPRHVLGAFRCFLDAVPGSRTHARFEFAGKPGPHTRELQNACDGRTTAYLGLLSHSDALRAMAVADVNVVILPNVPGGEHDTTAKIYECLGSGRPVLAAIPPDGAAAQVLRGHEGVWICEPDDIMGIARALTEIYRCWLAGSLRFTRSRESLRPLTREYQAGLLADCLDAVARRPASRWGSSR